MKNSKWLLFIISGLILLLSLISIWIGDYYSPNYIVRHYDEYLICMILLGVTMHGFAFMLKDQWMIKASMFITLGLLFINAIEVLASKYWTVDNSYVGLAIYVTSLFIYIIDLLVYSLNLRRGISKESSKSYQIISRLSLTICFIAMCLVVSLQGYLTFGIRNLDWIHLTTFLFFIGVAIYQFGLIFNHYNHENIE